MSKKFSLLLKRYFGKKDYIMLYIDNFLSNFASSIYNVFTPVILYQSGFCISIILYIYAIQFLVMGLFTPLSGLLSKKYGVANTKLIGYILRAVSLLLVFTIQLNSHHYLLVPIIYGISGAINNPLKTYLPSKIVKENFRGRFNAFLYILNCISSVIAYIFVAIFLTKNNHFVILIVVFLCYLLSIIALFNLTKSKFYYRFRKSFQESYSYLFANKENQSFKRASGLRSFIIIERLIAVPLYLYISLNDLKTFTFIYVISTLLELLSLIISGKMLDQDRGSFYMISSMREFISFIFIIAREKLTLLFNQSLYKLSDNVYDSAYCTLVQSKVEYDKTNTFILSMVHEMSLCFYEFIILSFLSIIGGLNSMVVFKIIFICSILVVMINSRLIRNWKEE